MTRSRTATPERGVTTSWGLPRALRVSFTFFPLRLLPENRTPLPDWIVTMRFENCRNELIDALSSRAKIPRSPLMASAADLSMTYVVYDAVHATLSRNDKIP